MTLGPRDRMPREPTGSNERGGRPNRQPLLGRRHTGCGSCRDRRGGRWRLRVVGHHDPFADDRVHDERDGERRRRRLAERSHHLLGPPDGVGGVPQAHRQRDARRIAAPHLDAEDERPQIVGGRLLLASALARQRRRPQEGEDGALDHPASRAGEARPVVCGDDARRRGRRSDPDVVEIRHRQPDREDGGHGRSNRGGRQPLDEIQVDDFPLARDADRERAGGNHPAPAGSLPGDRQPGERQEVRPAPRPGRCGRGDRDPEAPSLASRGGGWRGIAGGHVGRGGRGSTGSG